MYLYFDGGKGGFPWNEFSLAKLREGDEIK